MAPVASNWDPKDAWAPYAPGEAAPWDLRRVVHLHRRAGFAATWNELQRDLRNGPGKSIDRLLHGQSREGVPDNFRFVADTLPGHGLKAWWIYRMYWGPDPLGERLTLAWHNHFATSNDKVNDLAAMHRQNEIFRKLGRGAFGDLLKAVVHDPALLLWLDAPANLKGKPNENLGRELMELFTLGIGHYTEQDVKEAARALTGWKLTRGEFRDWAPDHDDGEKTLLGQKGRWKGDDVVRILLEHPATSRRLAWRLCEWPPGAASAVRFGFPVRLDFAGRFEPIECGIQRPFLEPQQPAPGLFQAVQDFQAVRLALLQRREDHGLEMPAQFVTVDRFIQGSL